MTWKKNYDQPRQHIKKQRHYFSKKGASSQSCGFPSIHVWMWELDYKESWAPKNWCFWTVVLEKSLEREIQPVHPKGNQSWIFIGYSLLHSLGLQRARYNWETELNWTQEIIQQGLKRIQQPGTIDDENIPHPWISHLAEPYSLNIWLGDYSKCVSPFPALSNGL